MIILIEDDKIFAESLIRKLKKVWIENVKWYSTIWSYEHQEADLYITDIRLEHNSFDLIKDIRKNTNKIILALSHFTNKDYMLKALNSWADLYIDKMCIPDILVKKIFKILLISQRLWKK